MMRTNRTFMVVAALACLAGARVAVAQQMPDKDDMAAKRARLEQAQAQVREDLRIKLQMLSSVTQSQALDDASFRRQEASLVSSRSEEAEVQRQLIKADLRAIEAQVKVDTCPDYAPDRRVVLAELKIADAQRRYLGEQLDSIRRSIDQSLGQVRNRAADLEARRAGIDALQTKAQRIAAELDRMASARTRPATTVAAQ